MISRCAPAGDTGPERRSLPHAGSAGGAEVLGLLGANGSRERCACCRAAILDARFSAQLLAPGRLPFFFDDLGCLADFLKAGWAPPRAVVFVADHRTKAWVRADHAVYTRVPGLDTPMGSHLVAHAEPASRQGDPDARSGTTLTPCELFGPDGPPAGRARPR